MTRILLMRHGHSVANQKGLIISATKTGCTDYGLSSQGKQEVKEALNLYQDCLSTVTRIVCSDFLRTIETAKTISDALLIPLELESDLRERFFGALEGTSNTNYDIVWNGDQNGVSQIENLESVERVATRMTNCVHRLCNDYPNDVILIISHGDPLQILVTVHRGKPAHKHREMKPIVTAQLVQLKVSYVTQ